MVNEFWMKEKTNNENNHDENPGNLFFSLQWSNNNKRGISQTARQKLLLYIPYDVKKVEFPLHLDKGVVWMDIKSFNLFWTNRMVYLSWYHMPNSRSLFNLVSTKWLEDHNFQSPDFYGFNFYFERIFCCSN